MNRSVAACVGKPSTATAIWLHIAVNLSQFNRSSLIVTMSDLASDDQIAHQISENSDQQQPRPASCGGGCGCWSPYTGNLVEVAVGNIAVAIEDRCRGWGPLQRCTYCIRS